MPCFYEKTVALHLDKHHPFAHDLKEDNGLHAQPLPA